MRARLEVWPNLLIGLSNRQTDISYFHLDRGRMVYTINVITNTRAACGGARGKGGEEEAHRWHKGEH
jgi:hypothetical protein